MPRYRVEVRRTIECTVEVEAEDPEAARDQVNVDDFELPKRDEWYGHDDWWYCVYDQQGARLLADD